MRKINKKIILLSLILAAVMMNNSSIYATSTNRNIVNRNQDLIESSKTSIENSLKNNDYNLFLSTLKKLNINESVTNEQFNVLVKAYSLFRENKTADAVKLLKDNNLNPIFMRFVNNKPDLTDAQKTALKKASELIKQGKIDEAKTLVASSSINQMPVKIEKKINKVESKVKKEEIKKAFDQSRELKKEGKIDEAKKVLKDAGVPDMIQDKIRPEFEKAATSTKKSIFQSIKGLFIK